MLGMEPQITLGAMYRDKFTGFEGVASGRSEYVTGNPRVTLERKGDAKQETFDEARLVEVKE